jgi:prophage regulatory protein
MTDTAHDAPQAPQREKVREMLTAEQVLALIPVSRTTLFRMERSKTFPAGQAIVPHRKLWFQDEVIAWQKALQDPDSELSMRLRATKKAT